MSIDGLDRYITGNYGEDSIGPDLPEPTELANKLREGNPKLYRDLWLDEIAEHAQQIFDLHVAVDGIGILRVLDNIHWVIGDSNITAEWWEDTR